MARSFLASLLGWTSVVCSLGFWPLLGLEVAMPGWLRIDPTFNQWVLIWLLALAFAVAATYLGSRRWALAALLPLLSFVLCLTNVFLGEPREYYAG
jgi:hypothetical protein